MKLSTDRPVFIHSDELPVGNLAWVFCFVQVQKSPLVSERRSGYTLAASGGSFAGATPSAVAISAGVFLCPLYTMLSNIRFAPYFWQSIADIFSDYDDLEADDIRAVFAYAARLSRPTYFWLSGAFVTAGEVHYVHAARAAAITRANGVIRVLERFCSSHHSPSRRALIPSPVRM